MENIAKPGASATHFSPKTEPTYDLCVYERANATAPSPGSLTWSGIVDELTEGIKIERSAKAELPAFAPHALKDEKLGRRSTNVAQVSFLVIDVDACADLDAVIKALNTLGAPWCIYTTPSDQGPGATVRRIRVLVACDAPIVTGEDCAKSRLAVAELLGLKPGCGVEACLDLARLSFFGCVVGTPPREIWSGCLNERALPMAELLRWDLKESWLGSTGPHRNPAPKVLALASGSGRGTDGMIDALAALLTPHWEAGGRHAKTRALAGYLARGGWGDERIVSLVERLPSDQIPARLATARGTAAQARARAVTAGWNELTRELDTATCDGLEGIVSGPARRFAQSVERALPRLVRSGRSLKGIDERIESLKGTNHK